MKILIYDMEVFSNDWIIVVRDVSEKGKFKVIHNNSYAVKQLFTDKNQRVFGGFNNKHYDDWIIQTIINGGDNAMVKKHNDWVIGGRDPWAFPFIQYKKKPFKTFDLKDDLPSNLSLKAIEGNMNKSIVETGVDFNINRSLTEHELKLEVQYCTSDVNNTYELYVKRRKYMDSKLTLAHLKGMDEIKAIGLTNAKLTARYLDATKQGHSDEFEYDVPLNLKLGKYQYVLDFFKDPVKYTNDQLKLELNQTDKPRKIKSLTKKIEEHEFKGVYSCQLDTNLAGVPHVFGWGGLHGAIPNYFIQQDADHQILTVDVSSYYPSLMIQYHFLSRNTPSPEGFKEVYERRIHAKNTGDGATAGALKLVLNTTYGASKNQYNDLYDPRQANAVCISGQLFLTDLIDKLEAVNSFELIQSNTDGIIIRFEKSDTQAIDAILHEWESRIHMNMERTVMKVIAQKDVNNYVMKKGEAFVIENGKKVVIEPDTDAIKTKGGYVSLYKGGDFRNRSLIVLNKALVNYFMDGIPVEKTINDDNELTDFQMIAKTGSSYSKAIHEVNEIAQPVQKVNRVYASKNKNNGTLYKVKSNGRKDKIASLPEHCFIDNANEHSINELDKEFYIRLANKRIQDYLGGKRKMATTKTVNPKSKTTKKATPDISKMNLYEKINELRQRFLDSNVQKTGVNSFSEYKYFELADIVPVAIPLMHELHLVPLITFNDDYAQMKLVDTDSLKRKADGLSIGIDFETFKSPMRELTVKGMNAIQALGAVETYQRRYLYMELLDIIEQDAIDSGTKSETTTKQPAKKSATKTTAKAKHVTPDKRTAAKKDVLDSDGKASETQIKSMKSGLKKLRDKDEKFNDYVVETVKAIKAGMSKKEAEAKLIEIGDKVAG